MKKITNHKSQITNKFQKFGILNFGVWKLFVIWCLVLGASFGLTNVVDAQVPGDFDINCQTCPTSNNDVLNCNNKEVAPYVNFTWTPSSGATKYEIYRKGYSTAPWNSSPIATITNLSSLRYIANVQLDSQNYYYIKATNANTGDFKSCSISYIPNVGGGCKAPNTNYSSGDAGAEANCVLPPALPATCTVSFNPATITSGGYTTQAWSSTNDADGALPYSCNGNLGSGTLPRQGSRLVIPTGSQRCTFTARNTAGTSATCSATITVNPAPPPTPTPSFIPPTPPPDVAPPVISNVRITNITTVAATVTWDTDEPADSQVEYCLGFTRCGTDTTLASQLAINHTVNLSALTPATTYAIWVKSRDGYSNSAILGYFLFTTLTQTAPPTPTPSLPPSTSPLPAISNIQITNITRSSATVTWDTDILSDSRVGICYYTRFCIFYFYRDDTLTTRHSIVMTDLDGGTVYDIKVRSRTASRKVRVSDILSFTTSPNLQILNPRVINISSTTATVVWDTNYPTDSQVKLCLLPYYCYGRVDINDSNLVTNHSTNLTGLVPNTTYYYRITAEDSEGSVRTGYLNFRTGP